jgi:hypothetical protein
MTTQRYSVGYEWKNHRGQFFVMQPDHPACRKDGFVSRAKLVIEALLDGGIDEGQSWPNDYAMTAESRRKFLVEAGTPDEDIKDEYLTASERVFHINGNPADDSPENLMLFPTQGALAQYRSEQYHIKRKERDKETLDNFTRQARELRERRRAAAKKGAEAARVARERRAAEEKAAKKR